MDGPHAPLVYVMTSTRATCEKTADAGSLPLAEKVGGRLRFVSPPGVVPRKCKPPGVTARSWMFGNSDSVPLRGIAYGVTQAPSVSCKGQHSLSLDSSAAAVTVTVARGMRWLAGPESSSQSHI